MRFLHISGDHLTASSTWQDNLQADLGILLGALIIWIIFLVVANCTSLIEPKFKMLAHVIFGLLNIITALMIQTDHIMAALILLTAGFSVMMGIIFKCKILNNG